MSACPSCGAADQPAGARFCFSCGSALEATCAQCSTALAPGARFCSHCGTPTSTASGQAAPTTQGGGQRRTRPHGIRAPVVASPSGGSRASSSATSSGFTTLSEARDHEETRELLTTYFDDARRIIGRYGGTVEKFIGDAVMAVWGVPTAHEDDAERAVRAGLELVTRVTDMGEDLGAGRPRRARRGRHG